MDETALNGALEAALAAADAADQVAMGYFGGALAVETKDDDSPVTRADREAEQVIRARLARAFPDHAIYGEEYGRSGDAPYLWLIDPIDGTRSFIRGLPFWSVQIALMVEGELVLGVSSAPALRERAWAARGQGAFISRLLPVGGPSGPIGINEIGAKAPPAVLSVKWCENLAGADISLGNLKTLAGSEDWHKLAGIVKMAARTRGYGDYYPYHRLAAGQLDAVIESDVNILDIAALVVIVREAGGVFTDLDGDKIGLDTTSVLAASPRLHGQLVSLLAD